MLHRHQFAFGMGGRMCVASHVASKALYTVIVHLVGHFEILPAEGAPTTAIDPIDGLLTQGNHQAAPAATYVKLRPRNLSLTKRLLSSGQ